MRALFLSILLLCSIKVVIGQSVFTMPDKNKDQQGAVMMYDSLYNIHFAFTDEINYLKDFEKYIGQEIIFYDFGANLKDKAEGYINFEAEPTIVGYDTIWLKRKKKVKPEHYSIDTIYSRKYNPTLFQNANIRDCSSIVAISRERLSGWDRWKPFSGYATSVSDINNKKFTIVDFGSKNTGTELHITLKGSDNNTLFWVIDNFSLDIYKWNNRGACWPVITQAFMDKMAQMYANQEFFFIRNNTIHQLSNEKLMDKTIVLNTEGKKCYLSTKMKYTFRDWAYVDIYGTYSVPCFLVEDTDENKFFIPFCRLPEYSKYSKDLVYEPAKAYDERWAYLEDITFKPADIVYEEQRLEQQKREELQQQKALETANRKAVLTKKYGSAIATLIIDEQVKVGMTSEMCRESWGEPSDVNRSTGPWGVHEQWVYYDYNYLYFENGKLTAIQN